LNIKYENEIGDTFELDTIDDNSTVITVWEQEGIRGEELASITIPNAIIKAIGIDILKNY